MLLGEREKKNPKPAPSLAVVLMQKSVRQGRRNLPVLFLLLLIEAKLLFSFDNLEANGVSCVWMMYVPHDERNGSPCNATAPVPCTVATVQVNTNNNSQNEEEN